MTEALDSKPMDIDIEALQVERRFAIVDDWTGAASSVAERSGIPYAREVADFLLDRTGVGIAWPNGGIYMVHRQKPELDASQYAFLTPLIDIDRSRLTDEQDWRRAIVDGSSPFIAQFREGSRAVYFSETAPVGNTGRGLVLLHETVHAINEINGLVDRSAPNQHWTEEADVYRFEYEIMAALGGEDYAKLVDRIADAIEGAEKDEGSPRNTYEFNPTDRDAVRAVFGPDTSDGEVNGWLNVVSDNAWLRYFERNFEQPMEQFADFLAHTQGQHSDHLN